MVHSTLGIHNSQRLTGALRYLCSVTLSVAVDKCTHKHTRWYGRRAKLTLFVGPSSCVAQLPGMPVIWGKPNGLSEQLWVQVYAFPFCRGTCGSSQSKTTILYMGPYTFMLLLDFIYISKWNWELQINNNCVEWMWTVEHEQMSTELMLLGKIC